MSLREAFDNIFQEEPKPEGGILDWLQNGLLADIPVGLGYGILSRNKEVDPLVRDTMGLLSLSDLQPGAKWSPAAPAPVLPGVEKAVDDLGKAMVNFGMANEVPYLQPESTLGQIGEGVVRSLPYSGLSIAASLIPRAMGPAGLPLSVLLTTLMESTSEQGDVFRDLLRKGVDMEQAVKLAQQAGNENMALLAGTNLLEQVAMSGVGLNALRHPIKAAGKLGATLRKTVGEGMDAVNAYSAYRKIAPALKLPPALVEMPAKAGVEAATAAASAAAPAVTGLKLPPLLLNLPATAVPVAAKAGVEAAEKPLSIWVRGLMDMMGEGAEEGGQNYISNRATGEEGGYFLPIATGMASSLLHTGASHLIDRYGPKEWRPQEENIPKPNGAAQVAAANAGRVINDPNAIDAAKKLPASSGGTIIYPAPGKLGPGEMYIQHKGGGQIMVVGKNETIPDGYRRVNQKGEPVEPAPLVSQGSDTSSHTEEKPADAVVPTVPQNPVTPGVTKSVTDDPVAQEVASNLPSGDPDTTPISEIKSPELLPDAIATLDQVQGVIVNEPVPDASEPTPVDPLSLVPVEAREKTQRDIDNFLGRSAREAGNEYYGIDLAREIAPSERDDWFSWVEPKESNEWTRRFDRLVEVLAGRIPQENRGAFIAAMRGKRDQYLGLAAGRLEESARSIGERFKAWKDEGGLDARTARRAESAETKRLQDETGDRTDTENRTRLENRLLEEQRERDGRNEEYNLYEDVIRFTHADEKELLTSDAITSQEQLDKELAKRNERGAAALDALSEWQKEHGQKPIMSVLLPEIVAEARAQDVGLHDLVENGSEVAQILSNQNEVTRGLPADVILQGMENVQAMARSVGRLERGEFASSMERLRNVVDQINAADTTTEFGAAKADALAAQGRSLALRILQTIRRSPRDVADSLVRMQDAADLFDFNGVGFPLLQKEIAARQSAIRHILDSMEAKNPGDRRIGKARQALDEMVNLDRSTNLPFQVFEERSYDEMQDDGKQVAAPEDEAVADAELAESGMEEETPPENESVDDGAEPLGILPSFKIPMPKIIRKLLSLFDPDMRHDTNFPTLRKEIQGFLGGAEQKMENSLRILRDKTKDQAWWTPRAAREALQYGIFDPKMPQEVQDLVRQVQNDYDAVTALRKKWGIRSKQLASMGDMLKPLYRSDVDPDFAPTPIAIRDSISELMKLHGMDLATASATVADIIDGKVDPKTLRPKFQQGQTQNADMMQRYGGIKQGVEHPLTMAMMGAVEDPLTLMYYNFRRHARWSAQQALVRATAQSVAQTANPMSKGAAIPRGWVPFEIPDSKGQPQPILAPGATDPLYVPKPVMDDILAMHQDIKPTEAKMIMTIFKSAKIRWSVTACMNNCVGNFFLGQIGGVSMVDQVREYPTAARELRQWVKEGKASPKLQEALDLGVLSGTMTEAELSMLGGTLDDVSRAKGFSGILKALYKVAHRASASKSYPIYEQIEMIHRYMLYRVVTTQGRMSTMQDIAGKGLRGKAEWKERLTGDKARDAVNDIVFDYEHDLPNYVKYLRGTVVPFISFPFLAGRSIAKNAVLRPHALLTAYGVGWALRAAVQAATGFELDLDNWIPFWDAADPEQRANTREVKSRTQDIAENFIPGGPFVLPFEEAAGAKLSGYPLKGWGRDAAEMMLPAVAVNAYNQLENVYEKGTPLPLAALRTIGIRLRPTDNEQKNKDIYVLRKKITNELEKHWARGGGEKSAMYTQGRIDKILESMQSVLEQNQP